MRLTVRGYGLLAAGAALVGAGCGLGYPELAALGAAAILAVAAGLAFVSWRPRLCVDRVADPDRVSRGEASVITLGIANTSRFFGVSLIARDRVTSGGGNGGGRAGAGKTGRAGAGKTGRTGVRKTGRTGAAIGTRSGAGKNTRTATVPVRLLHLRPGGVTGATYPVPTRRRGVLEVGPLQVARTDPFGLVSALRTYGESVRVWVRPRTHPIAAVPVGLSRSMDGRVDRVPQGTITFSALREYVIGDDLRHVHWRTSARVGELMVREHVDTSLPRIVILLDNRAIAHEPAGADGESATFESACEAAASVLVAAYRQDVGAEVQYVAGEADGALAPPRLGAAAVGAQLDRLAEAGLEPGDLPAAVERLRVRRVGDTLLYLTGCADPADLGVVASLRGAYPTIIVAVFSRAGPSDLADVVDVESGLTAARGLLVVGATDGADFAAIWDGIRAW